MFLNRFSNLLRIPVEWKKSRRSYQLRNLGISGFSSSGLWTRSAGAGQTPGFLWGLGEKAGGGTKVSRQQREATRRPKKNWAVSLGRKIPEKNTHLFATKKSSWHGLVHLNQCWGCVSMRSLSFWRSKLLKPKKLQRKPCGTWRQRYQAQKT